MSAAPTVDTSIKESSGDVSAQPPRPPTENGVEKCDVTSHCESKKQFLHLLAADPEKPVTVESTLPEGQDSQLSLDENPLVKSKSLLSTPSRSKSTRSSKKSPKPMVGYATYLCLKLQIHFSINYFVNNGCCINHFVIILSCLRYMHKTLYIVRSLLGCC